MRNFGQTSEVMEEAGFDPYSRSFVDTTVIGSALATSGIMGAFVGMTLAAVGIGAIELLRKDPIPEDRAALLYAASAGLFFLGVPSAVLKAEGRV